MVTASHPYQAKDYQIYAWGVGVGREGNGTLKRDGSLCVYVCVCVESFHLQWFRIEETLGIAKGKTLTFCVCQTRSRTGLKAGQSTITAIIECLYSSVIAMRQTAGDASDDGRHDADDTEKYRFHIEKRGILV